jgi:hypothetical protein
VIALDDDIKKQGLFVNDMIGDKDPKGGIVAGSCMVIWCPCLFISLQLLLSVDPDTSDAIFFITYVVVFMTSHQGYTLSYGSMYFD